MKGIKGVIATNIVIAAVDGVGLYRLAFPSRS
jgi:hypothetical protein